jgi:predicted RNA binding protein YcfA (HicA-like mRNA interferase family)
MSGHHPPLTCAEVKSILKNLGFKPSPRTGTSHEQWEKVENNRKFKVTVDCPKQPFSHDLIRYMARQAGVTVKEFYAARD